MQDNTSTPSAEGGIGKILSKNPWSIIKIFSLLKFIMMHILFSQNLCFFNLKSSFFNSRKLLAINSSSLFWNAYYVDFCTLLYSVEPLNLLVTWSKKFHFCLSQLELGFFITETKTLLLFSKSTSEKKRWFRKLLFDYL